MHPANKKNRHRISVAGFTIRSLTPVVTRLGRQFIASTHKNIPQRFNRGGSIRNASDMPTYPENLMEPAFVLSRLSESGDGPLCPIASQRLCNKSETHPFLHFAANQTICVYIPELTLVKPARAQFHGNTEGTADLFFSTRITCPLHWGHPWGQVFTFDIDSSPNFLSHRPP
jgi:hypothetical protein